MFLIHETVPQITTILGTLVLVLGIYHAIWI